MIQLQVWLQFYFLLFAYNKGTLKIKELNYNQIREVILQNKLHLLGRNEQQEEMYQKKLRLVKQQYQQVSDHILEEKFHLPTFMNSNGKKEVLRPLPSWSKNLIVTVPNDFPYNFEKNVKHLILWKLANEITSNDIQNEVLKLHNKYCFDEYCSFINPTHLKSILDVNHAHIILQLKDSQPYLRILRSTFFYTITGLSFLVTLKLIHTGYSYHTFLRELTELRTSLSIQKFLSFSTKYLIPFPLNFIVNYLLRRFQLLTVS